MDLSLPEYAECLFDPKRYKVLWGGRGGGKSETVGRVLLAMGMNKSLGILCARELQVSIQDSVHKLLANIIAEHPGFAAFYEVQNKTIIGKNGTEFTFKGLKHNIAEIKSMARINICWVEEAQAVSDKSWETLIPTVREPGSEIWLTFNPKNATDPTWQRFVLQADEDTLIRKINYHDNPFFPDVLDKERIRLLKNDPEAYNHIWLGEFDTRYSGAVYAKFLKQEQISPKVKHDPTYPVYTAWDLGFDDSTAIWFYQVGSGEVFLIDYYEASQEDIKHYAEACFGREIIVDERDNETGEVIKWHFGADIPEHAHRKAYSYHRDNVPHDAAYKLQAAQGRSIVGQMQRFGMKPTVIPATTQQQSIEALRTTLPKCWVNSDKCADGIHALMHYHFEYDDDRQTFKREPVHDWSSHASDAAEIMARVWRDTAKPLTEKRLEHERVTAKFISARREHGLERVDPYRVKPLRK